ncbi:uncharacterized protein [Clytia hemisphaerica]
MATDDLDLGKEIRNKIWELYADEDAETWARITYYLDEEERVYSGENSPVWKTLKQALKSDKIFKVYVNRLAEDTKRADKDEEFRKVMQKMYQMLAEPSENGEPCKLQLVPSETRVGAVFPGLAAMIAVNGKKVLPVIVKAVKAIGERNMMAVVDDAAGVFSKHGGALVTVVLSGVYLSFVALRNIYKWWRGEISGKRCAKSIIDTAGSVTGAVTFGMCGTAIGAAAGGPIGALVGGILGSLLGNYLAGQLTEQITETIFDLPYDVALEKSYDYLGVTKSSSNNDVNKAFRYLCLKHHPDKGGDASDFIILQTHMANIKRARGEF